MRTKIVNNYGKNSWRVSTKKR